MDCFLLWFIFSFWAAISILLLLHWVILTATISFTASLMKQAILWLFFVVNLLLTTRPGQAFWSFLSTVLCIVFIVPIVFYIFCKNIYDFGPRHCKQSFIDILTQPVPGNKFEEQNDGSDSHWHRRFNHKMVSRRLLQNKTLSSKVTTRSMTTIVHDCSMACLNVVIPRLHGYKTYASLNDSRLNKSYLDESPHTMQMTLYFAICHFSCPDLLFKTLPHWPPDGFILDRFAMSIISVIFGLLTLRMWVWLLQLSQRQFITKYRQLDWCKQVDNLLRKDGSIHNVRFSWRWINVIFWYWHVFLGLWQCSYRSYLSRKVISHLESCAFNLQSQYSKWDQFTISNGNSHSMT